VAIGITGSIGTGKSTISKMFKELGASLIDYDQLAHDVVEPGRPAYEAVVKEFGKGVLSADKTLNRNKLGEIVFNDKEKLKKLNNIIHPQVFFEDQRLSKEILEKNPKACIIKEVPLLTQIGINPKDLVDIVVVVSADYDAQVKRVMDRGFSREEARSRIDAQTPVAETEKVGDYVIKNNGTFDEARERVREVFEAIKKGSKKM